MAKVTWYTTRERNSFLCLLFCSNQ